VEVNRHPVQPNQSVEARLRTGQRVALVSIVINCGLAVSNIGLGLLAGSTSVVAAGLEFLGDVIASGAVLWECRSPHVLQTKISLAWPVETLAGQRERDSPRWRASVCYQSLQRVANLTLLPNCWPLAAGTQWLFERCVNSEVANWPEIRACPSRNAQNDAVDILSALVAMTALALTLLDPARFLAADHYGGFAVGLSWSLPDCERSERHLFSLWTRCPPPT
jgi:hypothetical protein